jgi:hypothetical protein
VANGVKGVMNAGLGVGRKDLGDIFEVGFVGLDVETAFRNGLAVAKHSNVAR